MNYKELKLKAQTEHGGYTLLAAGVCVFVKSKYHIDNNGPRLCCRCGF